MRCLVTGGCGFIGSALVRQLLIGGAHQVVVVDNLAHGSRGGLPEDVRVRLLCVDLRDRRALGRALEGLLPVDEVFHLAALSFVPTCETNPERCADINVGGTGNLVEVLRCGVAPKRFFLASSAAVYGDGYAVHREEDPPRPIDVYGRSKRDAEQELLTWSVREDVERVVIGRFTNVYGFGETTPHLLAAIVAQLTERRRAVRLGTLDAARDYVHVDDVIDATVGLMRDSRVPETVIVNVGSGVLRSVRQILGSVEELIGQPLRVQHRKTAERRCDPARLQVDVTKARTLIGWWARRNFRAELGKMLAAGEEAIRLVNWHLDPDAR